MKVEVRYKNWRGETADRRIVPAKIYFGKTDWHPEPGWLIDAYDVDREANRLYALADVEEWLKVPGQSLSDRPRTVEEVRDRIVERGDLPHVTVEEQLSIVEEMAKTEIGKWRLAHRALNGYWTDRVKRYDGRATSPFDAKLMEMPVCQAARKVYQVGRALVQEQLRAGQILASVPCGLMRDLLTLDYSKTPDVQLVGVDLDPESLTIAANTARERNLEDKTTFWLRDAWNLPFENTLDLITSHGLNTYIDDRERLLALYRSFYRALKPGGKLLITFLNDAKRWKVSKEALLFQRIVTQDICETDCRHSCTEEEIGAHLKAAGFNNIEFCYDDVGFPPTVLAFKGSISPSRDSRER